jgi:hypothetical protein
MSESETARRKKAEIKPDGNSSVRRFFAPLNFVTEAIYYETL